jgi:hypothetical protein
MPYFKVMLSGRGIELSLEGTPVVGFFTTRVVRSPDISTAQRDVMERVLSEWRPGGEYAAANRGSVPALAVENSFQVPYLAGLFGRKGGGYTFYRHEG